MSTYQITGKHGLLQYPPDDEEDLDMWQCDHCGKLIKDGQQLQFRDMMTDEFITSCEDCWNNHYEFYN